MSILSALVILGAIPPWIAYIYFRRVGDLGPKIDSLEERQTRSFTIALLATVFAALAISDSLGLLGWDLITVLGALSVILFDLYAVYAIAWLRGKVS